MATTRIIMACPYSRRGRRTASSGGRRVRPDVHCGAAYVFCPPDMQGCVPGPAYLMNGVKLQGGEDRSAEEPMRTAIADVANSRAHVLHRRRDPGLHRDCGARLDAVTPEKLPGDGPHMIFASNHNDAVAM